MESKQLGLFDTGKQQKGQDQQQIQEASTGIYKDLSRYSKWILWKVEYVNDKPTKVPYQPNGNKAKTDDKTTWCSFDEVQDAFNCDGYDGIGFVLSKDDPFSFVDLDKCIEDGETEEWSQEIIDAFQSWTEISWSGAGYHIICRGVKKGLKCRTGNFEMYDSGRFIALTGNIFNGMDTINECQEQLNNLYDQFFPAKEVAKPIPKKSTSPRTAQDVLEVAGKDSKFNSLFGGDIPADKSQSEADASLCCKIAFYAGPDPSLIKEIFDQSALAERSKWKNREDYRTRTIDLALQSQSEFYKWPVDQTENENKKAESLKDRIMAFIKCGEGQCFTTQYLDRELDITQGEKSNRSTILNRLKNDGILESGLYKGQFRVVNDKKQPMNFMNIKKSEVSLPLPLDINKYTKVLPGSVIVVGGASNGGKTGFLLNIIHSILNSHAVKLTSLTGDKATRNAKLSESYAILNEYEYDIPDDKCKRISILLNEQLNGVSEPIRVNFLNSEMGEEECLFRFESFPGGTDSFISHDNFIASERYSDFHDVIETNAINIVDYLPVHDQFWLVGDKIKKMKEKLGNGILVLALQKDDNKPLPRGAAFTKELARLSITLDNNVPYGHICSIIKNKFPLDFMHKLDGESRDFTLGGGAKILPKSD